MKQPLRQTVVICAIALHGESFNWAAASSDYELLMQISKSTPHTSTRTRLTLENVE